MQCTRMFLLFCCLLGMGCRVLNHPIRTSLDRAAAKVSFASWNIRSLIATPQESHDSRAFRIASLSNRELSHLMCTCPAPSMDSLCGRWNGINKGIGAAMLGLMQDVKVIECEGCRQNGHNEMVKQVAICSLDSRGWQVVRDPWTCQTKTMGNFVALPPDCKNELPNAAILDYSQADNRPWDPSRFLVDEIVEIEDGLLLGRANAQIGKFRVPVAYFVLERATAASCDSLE